MPTAAAAAAMDDDWDEGGESAKKAVVGMFAEDVRSCWPVLPGGRPATRNSHPMGIVCERDSPVGDRLGDPPELGYASCVVCPELGSSSTSKPLLLLCKRLFTSWGCVSDKSPSARDGAESNAAIEMLPLLAVFLVAKVWADDRVTSPAPRDAMVTNPTPDPCPDPADLYADSVALSRLLPTMPADAEDEDEDGGCWKRLAAAASRGDGGCLVVIDVGVGREMVEPGDDVTPAGDVIEPKVDV